MAIQRMYEYILTDEWNTLPDNMKKAWITNFYEKSKLEIMTAYIDGKYKSEAYDGSQDYIKQNFEI